MRRRLRVLGSLELSLDDEQVDLGGPKQRLVLAILAAAGGHAASVERLVDGVWGDDPPPRAEASLQAYVSNLRRALEPDRPRGAPSRLLLTTPAGYRLELDQLDVDAQRFGRLATEGHDLLVAGDAAGAQAPLAEALALWRGRAYGEAADNPLVIPEAARLDELRWQATEDRWQAALQVGRVEQALPELQALIRRAPLRERAWVLLATALADAGRQVEALRAVREGMDVLREQVGLEPGPELRSLEDRLLRGPEETVPGAGAVTSPTSPPAAAAATAETRDGELRVRQAEIDGLLAVLDAAGRGRGATVAIAGEAGIGKTHLARQLGDAAAASGWAVAWGRCPEGDDVPGFWPFRAALDDVPRQLDGVHLRDLLPAGTPVEQLLGGGVGGDGADDPPSPGAAPAGSFAVATAIASVLRRISELRPLLLVVDDLQWADPGTMRVVRHLAGEVDRARMLVVLTHRRSDGPAGAALAALHADIARTRGGAILQLGGLDAPGIRSLLGAAADRLDDAEVEALRLRTGGNPFFVRELARSPQSTPAGVRDVVLHRADHLDPTARRFLDVLVVAGEEADVRLVADVAGAEPTAVLEALDRAVAAGLVTETSPGRHRPTHDLVREAAYDAMPAAARARLHQAVGAAVGRRWGDDPDHLPAQAWHLWKSLAVSDPAEVLDVVCRAASAADRAQRLDEAVEQWQRAADLLRSAGSADDRMRVLRSLGTALTRAGNVLGGRAPLLEAARLARSGGRWDVVSDVLTTSGDLSLWIPVGYGQVDTHAVELLEEARRHLDADDVPRRAAVTSRLATELYYSDDEHRIDLLDEEALDLARRAGAPRLLATCLCHRFANLQRPHRIGELLEVVEELRRLGPDAEAAPGELAAVTAVMAGYANLTLGELDRSAAELAAAERLPISARLPYLASQQRWYRVMRLVLAGHVEAAQEAWEEAAAFYARVGGLEPEATSFVCLAGLRLEQGRLPELRDELGALAGLEGRAALAFGELLVLALLDAGEHEEASARAAALDRRERPRDWVWLAMTCARAWARVRLGHTEAHGELLDQLAPHTGQVASTGQLLPAFGSVDLFLGLLAEATGDLGRAEHHLRAAAAANERLGSRPWLARTLAALARVAEARGDELEPAELRARAARLAVQVGNPLLEAAVGGGGGRTGRRPDQSGAP